MSQNGMGVPEITRKWSGWVVQALAVDDSNNLYAGGMFGSADRVAVNHIAKWDRAYGNHSEVERMGLFKPLLLTIPIIFTLAGLLSRQVEFP